MAIPALLFWLLRCPPVPVTIDPSTELDPL
jgi:hypothetical protein